MRLRYLPCRVAHFNSIIWDCVTHVCHYRILCRVSTLRNKLWIKSSAHPFSGNMPHYSLEYQSHNRSVRPLGTTVGIIWFRIWRVKKWQSNLQMLPPIGSMQRRPWVGEYESYDHIMPMCVAWVVLGNFIIDHDCFDNDINSLPTKVWLIIINIWWERS